ncbi:RagB/SusD family nutrient uptake outer membrane protein [Chitinophaga sp. Hz27]|uniref:RagB/SusD family nutrient uptake outer membrane protein n=1 Tax=Chitinophaga sp. Hz27 TaxID=3347169 RepID=UPI0035D5E544
MKNNFKKFLFIGLAASSALLTSCKKDYLDTTPTEYVDENILFNDMKGAWAAINGIHRAMYSAYDSQDQTGQSSVMIDADMMGEDIVMTSAGNGWWNASYQWTMHRNVNATQLRFVYSFYYKVIRNANLILQKIDAVPGDATERNAIKGQAYAYRAWAHFNLVQLFGGRYDAAGTNGQDGVVLALKAEATPKPQARATVAEVYTQVNKDLDSAFANLPATSRNTKSHFNGMVVTGLKARVALTQQNWQVAADLAGQVIAGSGTSLMSQIQYGQGFNSVENPEWIWGSYQVDDQTTAFNGFFAYMSANYNSTNIRQNPKAINSTLYKKFPATDIRTKLWDPTGASTPIPPKGSRFPYINQKFLAKSSGSSVGDVVYMRLAEMYYIQAEAYAMLNQDAQAANALFTVVSARNTAYTKSTNTGTALRTEISDNRRFELWGEGFRFFDLKRKNEAMDRSGTNFNLALSVITGIPAGDKQWQWLIPQDEINAGGGLIKQNPL